MEAKEILQDIIVKKPESAYTECAIKYLNDRTKAAYLVAEMYDDLIDYPEESRQLFGSQTCFKIIEFCRQN